MNSERLRELIKQAGGNPNYKAFRGHFLPPPPDYIDPATVDFEKFAELIVKECVWQVVKDDKVPHDIQVLIGQRFEKHFGVE